MSYILKYSSIIFTKVKINSRFGGSSRYKVIEDELMKVTPKRKNDEKKKLLNKDKALSPINEVVEDSKEKGIDEPQVKKSYTLNKSKIKRKCHAFGRLEKSKLFLAFYSISFPIGIKDDVCYKLFNTWLTRCRKNFKLTSYLWVAERQKNKTIHFHLLTNDFMPIESVNKYMASALATEKKKGTEALKEVNTEKYNGVDVKRVGGDTRILINYLAKYITKNEIEFYRLPWHCSRDISRLFTAINFEKEESARFIKHLPQSPDHYTEVKESDFFDVIGFKFTPKDEVFKGLDKINEKIYSSNCINT